MSTPNDRQLEDFLLGQGAESAAYRSVSGETAPAALDATVLALARAQNAAAPPPRPHAYRDRRWQWPLALVGCFVIVSSLVTGIRQERPLAPDEADLARAAVILEPETPSLLDAAVERKAPDKLVPGMQKSEMPAPPPAAIRRRPLPRENASVAAAAPEAPKSDHQRVSANESAMPLGSSGVAASAAAAPQPPAQAGAEAFAEAGDAQQDSSQPMLKQSAAAPAADSAPPPPAATTADARDEVKIWLTRIRQLMKEGQRAEARLELQRFRKQYPNMMLLPDLQKLEAEPVSRAP